MFEEKRTLWKTRSWFWYYFKLYEIISVVKVRVECTVCPKKFVFDLV